MYDYECIQQRAQRFLRQSADELETVHTLDEENRKDLLYWIEIHEDQFSSLVRALLKNVQNKDIAECFRILMETDNHQEHMAGASHLATPSLVKQLRHTRQHAERIVRLVEHLHTPISSAKVEL